MYSLERRREREGGRPGVFEEVEADFARLERGGWRVRLEGVCWKGGEEGRGMDGWMGGGEGEGP